MSILYWFLIFSSSTISTVATSAILSDTSQSSPVLSCADSGSLKLPTNATTISLTLSPLGKMCTLTVNRGSGNENEIIPIGRSYDNYPWEAAAGIHDSLDFECDEISCEVTLPASYDENWNFQLNTFEHSLSRRDEIARFFEQSTFGVRLEDLTKMENEANVSDLLPSFVQWTHDQIYQEDETSHRQFWRERLMPLHITSSREGRAKVLSCEEGSYWRGFAFTKMDLYKFVEIEPIGDKYSLSIDGDFRTMVDNFQLEDGFPEIDSFPSSLKICNLHSKTFAPLMFRHNDTCKHLIGGNPPINIDGMNPQPAVINGTSMSESVVLNGRIEKMTLLDFSSSDDCASTNQPKFVKIPYQNFTQAMIFEARLSLLENTNLNPLLDGGGGIMKEIGGEEAQCSNAPRTFLNENNCQLSAQASTCIPTGFVVEGSVKLTPANIRKFYSEAWRYVYAVSNLRLEDDYDVESPCVHGIRSRWIKDESSNTCDQNIGEDTAAIFRGLINHSEDSNPYVKDLVTPGNAWCNWTDETTLHMIVRVAEECWKTVHPDHLNVYDFSKWKNTHPGSETKPQSIKQFAFFGSHILEYPTSHEMGRWKASGQQFPYVGRLGDEVEFKNFPETLRSGAIPGIFGLATPTTDVGTKAVVCGSPHEVGGKLFPTSFSMIRRPESNVYSPHIYGHQRRTVWTMIALVAKDQLRQRVSWALSQLLVISPSSIVSPFQTESFLTYYDIFVRHAFGNYFDILKEVSYSPMMAEMLSFLDSKSTEYVWKEQKEVQFADENFAREILQLFTIGLIKLNIDGTKELDSNGNAIPTYNNDDITEYARVWTGFRRQQPRGNTEERFINTNSIDPMAIQLAWRDQFPKMGLEGRYIGDFYPLCSELPPDSFLRKNAKYRLLGKSKQSDIQGISPSDIPILHASSLLLQKLCQPDDSGACTYPGVVHLEEDISCVGIECNLSLPKALNIGNDVHYEYIKTPCVNFPFTANNDVVIVVNSSGKVAIERKGASRENYDSFTYFRVEWRDGKFPNVDNSCGNGTCQELYGKCRCQTTVQDSEVFSSIPLRNDILSQLSVGAIPLSLHEYDVVETYQSFKLYSRNGAQMLGQDSVFEVKDDFGRMLYLKNFKSSVIIPEWGKDSPSSFEFRNTPSFYDAETIEVINAIHETDAALEHYFFHPNTAPFIALRMIQRFGISNPTRRFVEIVAQAFKSGQYEVTSDLPSFGTGKYGDLSATFAAILLDRESRNVAVDSDPSSGAMREPIIKIISLMRSMNYIQNDESYVSLYNLQSLIGQGPHDMPSVFSFFLPEYAPPGILHHASLAAPEAMVLQKSIGLVNGAISLIKYGLNVCDGGFGGQKRCTWKYNSSVGRLSYSQGNETDATKIVDDLATLLTSGRLSKSQREIIEESYMKESDKSEALRLAQQLTILSPEHHVTGIIQKTSQKRPELPAPTKSCQEYKAVVHILLKGGCDSYNMLVPHSQCQQKDMYDEYKSVRGSISLPKNTLLPIDAHDSDQVCDVFGIHPNLPFVKELYDEKEALFFSGIGVLSEPVTRHNYETKTKTQLFAHNTIQAEISRLDPHRVSSNTGTLGRLADVLSTTYSTNAFAVDTDLIALEGRNQEVLKTAVNSEVGFQKFNPSASDGDSDPINSQFSWINADHESHSNFFGQTWSSSMHESIILSGRLYDAQSSVKLNQTYPDDKFGRQLKTISNVVASHDCRGSTRDIFYIETGSYDHHSNVLDGLRDEFESLNEGLVSFVNEMKNLPGNVWDKVTIVVSSDFGRTLTSNSGGGTDHGWSGTSFVLGGSIKGGRIMGQYPDDLTDLNPLNVGRGRLIPTLPFEAQWNGVIQWLGVTSDSKLDEVLPNRKSFPAGMMLSERELFQEKQSNLTHDASCEDEGKEVACRARGGRIETDDSNYDDYPSDDNDDRNSVTSTSNDDDNLMLIIISAAISVCIVTGGVFAYRRSTLNKNLKTDDDDEFNESNATDISGLSEDLSVIEESL